MNEDVAVGVEDLRFGHKTEVMLVGIHYRQIPCSGVFEGLHHFVHRQIKLQDSRGRGDELSYRKSFVETGLEHDVAYLV